MIPTSPRLSKTEFICKRYGVLIFLMDLPRGCPGVSGPTGVSGPNDRSLRPLLFSLPNVFVWCVSGLGPEVPRRWGGVSGPTGVSGPNDPESLVLRFSLVSGSSVVRSWTLSGGTPEKPRNLRSGRNLRLCRPDSPVCLSLRKIWCASGACPEVGRSLAGMSGRGRSLRPT